MGPLTRLIEKIPHPGLRRVVGVGLMLAASLGIGLVLEKSLDPTTLRGLQQAQSDLYTQVSSMTPLRLAQDYAGDVDAAFKGQWIYLPGVAMPKPLPITPEVRGEASDCISAQLGRTIGNGCEQERAAAGMSASECLVSSSTPECSALLDCISRPPPPLPAGCSNSVGGISSESAIMKALREGKIAVGQPTDTSQGQSIHALLIPLAAISHGVSRIAADGAWGITFTVLQLLAGLVAFVLLTRAMRSGKIGFGDGWMNYILGPVCVVALGSLVALAMQGVMMAGLFLFGWLTGLAAGCACATGIASGAWWTFAKLAEKGVEDAVTKRL